MPYNMKKAGIKYQNGGGKKKAKTQEQKAQDVKKAINSRSIDLNQSPSKMIDNTKKYWKDVGTSVGKYFGLMQKGGAMKEPNPADYIGNPMGYYANKAQYGREMARRKMMQEGGPYDSNIEALNVLEQEGDAMRARKQKRLDAKLKRKQTREKISGVNADIARNRSDKRAANQSNRRFKKQNGGGYDFETRNAASGKIMKRKR